MNFAKEKIKEKQGITLVALVVTIVVLLILAGITLTYVLGDNSVFSKAVDAKLKTDIANWQERLEVAKNPIFIEGLGTFNPDKYFEYIQEQGIINNKDTDVINNGDGTYDVTTKPGYVFLVTLIPTPENPTDIEIEYIGQAGKLAPIVKRLDVSATSTSITGKAVVSRLGNGTLKYYYKSTSADDSTYQEITNITQDTGATQSTGITAGTKYTIKVVAKNDIGEDQKTAEITATKIFIESITIVPNPTTVKVGKTVPLTVTILPTNATNKWFRWSTSDVSVFSVGSNKLEITGKKEGTATLTVEAADGSNVKATCTVAVKNPTVGDIVGQTQTSNRTILDENGNKIVIPGGFKVVPNGTGDVTYNYDKNHNPCVQDGIVIEDNEGNQFVWIPVGNIKNKDGTTTTITLGRYTFNTTNGVPTLQQNATNYTQVITVSGVGGNYYRELSNNSLSIFITKTNINNGYYLGRYEASKGSDGKADSQENKLPWISITKSDAITKSREIYRENNYVESNLINSYAWDTAIVFIQKYSGNSNYANEKSVNTSQVKTGKTRDKACNIHEMASNCQEIDTENSTATGVSLTYPIVARGGVYSNNNLFTSSSRWYLQNVGFADLSFRLLLYLK